MMLRHQRPPGPRLSPVPSLFPTPLSPSAPHIRAPSMPSVGTAVRALPRPKSTDDVAPLRKPLPAMAPRPPKPKRPPQVNIEQWKSSKGAPPRGLPVPTGPRGTSGSPLPGVQLVSISAPTGAPRLPQRDNKPGRLPRQSTTVDIDDDQEPYDDIGSLEINDSWSDSQSKDENDEIYEDIDANQKEQIQMASEKARVEVPEVKLNKKEVKRQLEQERKEQQERQRREEQLRKNFQLQLPVEVLHTASVRHDWSGTNKLDLSVRQGDKVDIIRVKDNPEGKWLARTHSDNYGYISNSCVDIDYEAIRRKATQIKRVEHYDGELPPPPPDPPSFTQRSYVHDIHVHDSHVHNSHVHDSHVHDSDPDDDDKYDDVDFPPPPIELNIDPKIEKELKKKFKFEGPLKVLQTMMVDPNALLKKPGPKDLNVSPGDVLDILQMHSKKALCRNKFGKFGYVNKSHLLPLEGDIYDDVEYPSDVYDNDNADY
ncbi:hypothetical protein NL108_013475 [Boleophthalmus pectinirostris]|nr:hypothetical protein NL108_013475 [Boleophthalmus pectinirostris]